MGIEFCMVSKQAGTPKVAQCSHTTPIYSDASVVTTYNESGLKYKMEKKKIHDAGSRHVSAYRDRKTPRG
jgi:hypothetical protein